MAQFLVRNLEDDVHEKLKQMARQRQMSMEECVRDILREAALRPEERRDGLGTRLATRFKKYKITEVFEQLPRQTIEPMEFNQ